jgi:hypothetical protein
MPKFPEPEKWVSQRLAEGMVIPAHPLALSADGTFDERYQRALTRYYAAAGAGGVAVGVHATQFEIRAPGVDLLKPVLRCAAGALDELERSGANLLVRIAGVCGKTAQARKEAELAGSLGYHAGLISLATFGDADDDELIRHCLAVATVIPIMGFYLQRAVGGRRLGFEFWRRFAEIPNVLAIKIAPFNRYETLDVIRGVGAAHREGQIALYTGNDDNIIPDLLTRYDLQIDGRAVTQRIVGGLLGHWGVWTRSAVEIHQRVRALAENESPIPPDVLSLGAQITDSNAALFDVAHDFVGCIPGVQYVLFGQNLLESPRCLNPDEVLSPGQAEQIERVRRSYPHLIDDEFVAEHLEEFLS